MNKILFRHTPCVRRLFASEVFFEFFIFHFDKVFSSVPHINNDMSSSSSPSSQPKSKPRAIYLRDDAACRYDLSVQSPQHPMKPWRLTAVHGVVRRLGLFDVDDSIMQVMTPPALPADMLKDFHLSEYINDLEQASGDCWKFAPIDENQSTTTTTTNQNQNQTSTSTTTNTNKNTNDTSTNNNNSSENSSSENQQQQTQKNQIPPAAAVGSIKAPPCFSPFDCPVVQGGLEYSRIVAGSSLFGATLLNSNATDIVINWNGGMHHARAGTCSGFCYVNDCVIAIRELLRAHERVLYIDLDVHHGDGVEEAFYDTDRVFCLSLHKFADGFFPGTGHPADIGVDAGRYYTMNVPLRDGVRDNEYLELFHSAFRGILKKFKPEVIVCQCGADSLAGDRVGGTCMRLSSAGHAACVRAVRDSGLKVLALGGGGYAVRNVARLWAFETAVLCGCDDSIVSDDHLQHQLKKSTIPNHPRIHSRTMFSLPDPASVLNYFPLHADENESIRQMLKDVVSCSDPRSLQLKLEERALLMIFPEFAVSNNTNTSKEEGEDSSKTSSSSSNRIRERVGNDNNKLNKEDLERKQQQHFVSLFISSDDGGFEVRQNYSAMSSGGAGAVIMQRFIHTTLKRIQEHLSYL